MEFSFVRNLNILLFQLAVKLFVYICGEEAIHDVSRPIKEELYTKKLKTLMNNVATTPAEGSFIATVDRYWLPLKTLDKRTKLYIAEKLLSSVNKEGGEASMRTASDFCGTWEDDKPAEELVKEIRASRYYGTRDVASFD